MSILCILIEFYCSPNNLSLAAPQSLQTYTYYSFLFLFIFDSSVVIALNALLFYENIAVSKWC